jgi:hypothetical protein
MIWLYFFFINIIYTRKWCKYSKIFWEGDVVCDRKKILNEFPWAFVVHNVYTHAPVERLFAAWLLGGVSEINPEGFIPELNDPKIFHYVYTKLFGVIYDQDYFMFAIPCRSARKCLIYLLSDPSVRVRRQARMSISEFKIGNDERFLKIYDFCHDENGFMREDIGYEEIRYESEGEKKYYDDMISEYLSGVPVEKKCSSCGRSIRFIDTDKSLSIFCDNEFRFVHRKMK